MYACNVVLDPSDCPKLFRDGIGKAFVLLTLLSQLVAIALTIWAFGHTPWWEPLVTLFFANVFAMPLAITLLDKLGDTAWVLAFMLMPFATLLLAGWVFL